MTYTHADLLTDLGVHRPAWQRKAACRGLGTDLFFPEGPGHYDSRPVKAICAACPVQGECLAYSNRQPKAEAEGIWGGLGTKPRRRMRGLRDRNVAA